MVGFQLFKTKAYFGLTPSELDAIARISGAFTTSGDSAVILDLDCDSTPSEVTVNGETVDLDDLRQLSVSYVHFTE